MDQRVRPHATSHYDVVKRSFSEERESVWASVPCLCGAFHFPWEAKEVPKTEFRAFHDGIQLYFRFDVWDAEVVVAPEWNGETTVDGEDRVELFFAADRIDQPTPEGMPLYYGLEMDPKGRVHDYSAEYYRHFHSEWNMKELVCRGFDTSEGYVVEGSIALDALKELGVLRKGILRAGVYRAEFSASGEGGPIMQWISWVDPKTEAPDFHVDSSFGEFRLVE